MENKDKFLEKMENLQLPAIDPQEHPKKVKMAILNAERSAAIGVWLIILPCYFLLCVFVYYYSHDHASWFASMFAIASSIDKGPLIDFLAPIVLILLPIVCIISNALAITHFSFNKRKKEEGTDGTFNLTVKIKLWNIVLIILSVAIITSFIIFSMTESISIKN